MAKRHGPDHGDDARRALTVSLHVKESGNTMASACECVRCYLELVEWKTRIGSCCISVRWSAGAGLPTDFTFTSQRAGSYGTIFMSAREYLPSLGRFLSADSIVPGAGNPQALNRYAYVFNSPLRYSDPTGHLPTEDGPDGLAELLRALRDAASRLPPSQYPCAPECGHTFANNPMSAFHGIVQIDALSRFPGSVIEAPCDGGCVDVLLPGNRFYEIKSAYENLGQSFAQEMQKSQTSDQVAKYIKRGLLPASAVDEYFIDIAQWVPNTVLRVSSWGTPGLLYYEAKPKSDVPGGIPVLVPQLMVEQSKSPKQVASTRPAYNAFGMEGAQTFKEALQIAGPAALLIGAYLQAYPMGPGTGRQFAY